MLTGDPLEPSVCAPVTVQLSPLPAVMMVPALTPVPEMVAPICSAPTLGGVTTVSVPAER